MIPVAIFYPVTATLAVAGNAEAVAYGPTAPNPLRDFGRDGNTGMKPALAGLWRFDARLRIKNDALATVTELEMYLFDATGVLLQASELVTIPLGDKQTLSMSGIVEVRNPLLDVFTLYWTAQSGTPTIDGSQPSLSEMSWEYLGQ